MFHWNKMSIVEIPTTLKAKQILFLLSLCKHCNTLQTTHSTYYGTLMVLSHLRASENLIMIPGFRYERASTHDIIGALKIRHLIRSIEGHWHKRRSKVSSPLHTHKPFTISYTYSTVSMFCLYVLQSSVFGIHSHRLPDVLRLPEKIFFFPD